MNVRIVIFTMCLMGVVSCRRIERKPTKDPFHDFIGDPDLEIPEEDDDTPPTNFTGNLQTAKITNSVNKNHGKGKFKYTFETQNGISIAQVGKLKDNKTFVVMGSYAYTGADGKRYRVRYTADEFGYHPITMLDIDIPEINFTKAEVKPSTLTRPSFNLSLPKKDSNASGGQNNNLLTESGSKSNDKNVNNYQKETFHVSDDIKVKVNDVSNIGGGNKNGLNDNDDKPLVTTTKTEIVDRTYLPPKEFIISNREYLPPVGLKPLKTDY